MKPILFNTDMVRAILEGRKTVTRRVVKPQPKYAMMTAAGLMTSDKEITIRDGIVVTKNGSVSTWRKLPYQPGDILYVRETWARYHEHFLFKTNCVDTDFMLGQRGVTIKWRPSIHMPREAARIFLRVTDVRVERLQDITEDDMVVDFGFCRDAIQAVGRDTLAKSLWNSTIKPANRALYGWDANPWCWVIEFEHISKEETTQ